MFVADGSYFAVGKVGLSSTARPFRVFHSILVTTSHCEKNVFSNGFQHADSSVNLLTN